LNDQLQQVSGNNSIQRNQSTAISERKLKANRENAQKSTGPKTLRGKSFSRRNALKHGLFVNHVTDFAVLDEDPKQYEELLNGLWNQYQPVGGALRKYRLSELLFIAGGSSEHGDTRMR
jgi:hypothetical protein